MRPNIHLGEQVRLCTRMSAFVGFLLVSIGTLALLRVAELCSGRHINRAPLVQRYCAVLCRLLGMKVQTHGTVTQDAALRVCNHVSWTDIPLLGSCLPLRFLAKREVASWPVIGWIARQIGTLFVQRGGGDFLKVQQTLTEALAQRECVLIFPEGTTTSGERVRKFHPRLIGAAITAGCPVQAITIAYHRDGQPDLLVPFIGDDDFVAHLPRLLRQPAVQVDILFHPPLTVSASDCPNQLARTLHQQVSQGLEALRENARSPTSHPANRASAHPAR